MKERRAPLAYLAMRTFAFSLIVLLLIAGLADTRAPGPQFRPALIGNGPGALVNVIDTKKLMEKGQRDGLVMFKAWVTRLGEVSVYNTYGETPGSKLLKEKVGDALSGCLFIPAIYDGKRTDVGLLGTVVFVLADGKPHLRIYMNQNHEDLAKGNDFIAPQLVASSVDSKGSQYEWSRYKYAGVGWTTQLSVSVDANGNQKDLEVTSEDPPGFGVAAMVRNAYAKAKWIPGFRNGHPVECTFEYRDWSRTWHLWQPHN